MENRILKLEQSLNELKTTASRLDGKYQHLVDNSKRLEEKEIELKQSLEYHNKAVEVLNMVQKVTTDKVKEQFENLVSYALQYILGNDEYKFVLEFGNRGNLGELNFNISTPECRKPVDLFTCNAGGELDICSLALRIVLLELDQRKEKNFVILDEPDKWVNGIEYQEKTREFIDMINKRLGYQTIFITQKDIFTENCDNPIEIK